MSQHDFNIANQTFPSFRSDLNDALQAAATISAGATAPTTPYAYQLWFDTSTNTYKARNAGNSAWISLFGNDLTNGGITFGDNDKAIFGAGSDLQIYHNSANNKSYIEESGSGNLVIRGSDIDILAGNGEAAINVAQDGAVTLYHDNATKLATTATGCDITGTVTADGLTVDGTATINGAGGIPLTLNATGNTNLQFNEGGALRWYIRNVTGSNDFNFYGNGASRLNIGSTGDISFYNTTGTAKLFWDASAESLTLNSSLRVEGGTTNGFLQASGGLLQLGASTASSLVAYTNNAEAMRIDSSGRILCGTTDTDVFNNTSGNGINIKGSAGAIEIAGENGEVLYLNRMGTDGRVVNIRKSGTFIGGIDVTTSAVSYNTSSDYRLKENVVADWDATTRLKQLNPVRFNFIANPDTTVDGFLAHEVQDIVPEAITGTKDAMRDEEYTVSPATGDIYTPAIEAALDEDGNEVTPAVAEVIHSTDVERPEELAEGQQWRETTAAVMGTRSVPDYQGIDQSKLVPLLVKTIQELEARITALEAS